MSDLENFVNQSGRDKGVKDVRKKINELYHKDKNTIIIDGC